ncbi:MAG: hypothetical protein U0871_28910, partial [Gemmataceae bacterium]
DGTVFVWEADRDPAAARRQAAADAARYLFHLRTATEAAGDARQATAARFHLDRLRDRPAPTPALRQEYDALLRSLAGRGE